MRRAESKTAVDQLLATFYHLCVALGLIVKPSLPVEGRLKQERDTRERKVCRIAAAAHCVCFSHPWCRTCLASLQCVGTLTVSAPCSCFSAACSWISDVVCLFEFPCLAGRKLCQSQCLRNCLNQEAFLLHMADTVSACVLYSGNTSGRYG